MKRSVLAWAVSVFLLAFSLSEMSALVAVGQSSTQPQDPQQPGVIKVETALVTVPVIVTDAYGRFITGLSRRDFTVKEDGARQEISSFSSSEAPFNVALLIDTSHSTQRKLGTIRKTALTFVKQLQPNDRVMIVTFDDQVRFVSELTDDREVLKRAIESVKSNYATSLYDAITLTVTQKLAQLSGRKAIVVLTDGVDTASRAATFESTLDLISGAGVICYAVQYETRNDGGPVMKPIFLPNSIGALDISTRSRGLFGHRLTTTSESSPFLSRVSFFQENTAQPGVVLAQAGGQAGGSKSPLQQKDRYLVATDFLRALAFQSGARYLRAETIESTSYAFALIADELRHQYTIAYYSSNDQRDGRLRAIDVSVPQNNLLVRSRQGYRAPLARRD
jgi:VWFA-related protein